MTLSLTLFSLLALGFLLGLVWLLSGPAAVELPRDESGKLRIESLFALHCRYFPQIRQILSPQDNDFLKTRASRALKRRWRAERRRVLRQFLSALGEDFFRLDSLARSLAALSPQLRRDLETERFWLGVRFQILYRLVSVRLALGQVSLPELARLTRLLGVRAAQLENGMTRLEEALGSSLRPTFSA